jgi:hypothetical protein
MPAIAGEFEPSFIIALPKWLGSISSTFGGGLSFLPLEREVASSLVLVSF